MTLCHVADINNSVPEKSNDNRDGFYSDKKSLYKSLDKFDLAQLMFAN